MIHSVKTTSKSLTIDRIFEKISNVNLLNNNPGLFAGSSGISIFLFHYAFQKKNSTAARLAVDFLINSFDQINEGFSYHTICDGITGYCTAVEYSINKGFLDERDFSFLKELDKYIYQKAQEDIFNKNTDFLHGSIGSAHYLLSRSIRTRSITYVEKIIEALRQTAKKDGSGVCWENEMEEGTLNIDLGLAHGLPSLMLFLASAISANICQKECRSLLKDTIQSFMSKGRMDENGHPYFPNRLLEHDMEYHRKTGWCYGDLGRGWALLKCGSILDDLELIEYSLGVIRNVKGSSEINSPFFCHGAAGIASIYKSIFSLYQDKEFYENYHYWLTRTEDLSGSIQEKDSFKAIENYSLLEGIAGVGLTLLSKNITPKDSWEKLFLL